MISRGGSQPVTMNRKNEMNCKFCPYKVGTEGFCSLLNGYHGREGPCKLRSHQRKALVNSRKKLKETEEWIRLYNEDKA